MARTNASSTVYAFVEGSGVPRDVRPCNIAQSALVVKGVCGTFGQKTPACVCECAEKMASFGFNVAP